jgi:DNA-binding response OmpR family regulator
MESKTEKNKHTILVIEDEPSLRDIYTTKLTIDGFGVLEAADGIDGLTQAIQSQPSLILLDVVLPIKDGFDVLKDLKANPRTSAIPVIILSNLGQPYEVKRGLALGAECFLVKANLTPSKIIEEVLKVLDKTASAQQ